MWLDQQTAMAGRNRHLFPAPGRFDGEDGLRSVGVLVVARVREDFERTGIVEDVGAGEEEDGDAEEGCPTAAWGHCAR